MWRFMAIAWVLAGCFVGATDRDVRAAFVWEVPELCRSTESGEYRSGFLLDGAVAYTRTGDAVVVHVTAWGEPEEVTLSCYPADATTAAVGTRIPLDEVSASGPCNLYAASLPFPDTGDSIHDFGAFESVTFAAYSGSLDDRDCITWGVHPEFVQGLNAACRAPGDVPAWAEGVR